MLINLVPYCCILLYILTLRAHRLVRSEISGKRRATSARAPKGSPRSSSERRMLADRRSCFFFAEERVANGTSANHDQDDGAHLVLLLHAGGTTSMLQTLVLLWCSVNISASIVRLCEVTRWRHESIPWQVLPINQVLGATQFHEAQK